MRPLNPKQARFVREYITSRNGEQAAIKAGYPAKTARSKAAHLLTNVNVKVAIQDQQDALAQRSLITAERVLREIALLAFSDIGEVFADDGSLIPVKNLPPSIRRAIASVKVRKAMEDKEPIEIIEYKLWDKGAAQDRLSRHLGLFMEQSDIEALRDKLNDLIAKIKASQEKP